MLVVLKELGHDAWLADVGEPAQEAASTASNQSSAMC